MKTIKWFFKSMSHEVHNLNEVYLMIMSGALVLIYGWTCFLNFRDGFTEFASLLLAGIFVILFSVVWGKKTGRFALPCILQCVSVDFLILYALVCGGADGFTITWALLIPPIGMQVYGMCHATLSTIILCLATVVWMWTPLGDLGYPYSAVFRSRFPFLFLVQALFCTLLAFRQLHNMELLEKLVEDAQSADRAKSSFLANMSHEIRTPINAILGMNEMILRESKEENVKEYATNVNASGNLLLGIINDVLDFSRIESGRMELFEETYSLREVLDTVMAIAQQKAGEKGLRLSALVDENAPKYLVGDSLRVQQIVMNVLTNAVKYTDEGEIVLRLDYEQKEAGKVHLKFTVMDTGRGIKKEDLHRMFESFMRVDEYKNRDIEGTGLGLSIVHRLITMMGGQLDVDSIVGLGSKFIMEIPQGVQGEAVIGHYPVQFTKLLQEKDDYKESFHAPDAKILVVDDIRTNILVVQLLLKNTQMQIDKASSGEEALALMEENKYDLVLLDHLMPKLDGVETLQLIRKLEGGNLPVIALSANVVSGAKDMYADFGFDDFLGKPISGVALEKILYKYLPKEKILPLQ